MREGPEPVEGEPEEEVVVERAKRGANAQAFGTEQVDRQAAVLVLALVDDGVPVELLRQDDKEQDRKGERQERDDP